MKGMESLVSNMLGINPDELRKQFEGKVEEFQAFATTIVAQLNRIEQNQILLYQLMNHAGLIPTPDEMRMQKMGTLPSPEKVNADAHGNTVTSD